MLPFRTYQALVTRVIDGDTVDCSIDLGFEIQFKSRFRLHGINTAETRTTDLLEKQRGLDAKLILKTMVENKPVVLHTFGRDKFGRWLADVFIPDDHQSVNQKLIELGLAQPFMV